MEKVINSTKRKKRRTRRCLDEIKNRLLRKSGNSFEHSFQNTKLSISASKKLEKHLVTNDRITLQAMFPNAVRSETITRPVLEEIKSKQNVHSEALRDNADKKSTFPQNQENVCVNMNTSASFHNVTFSEYGEKTLSRKNNFSKYDVKPTRGLVLLSPAGSLDNTVTLKSANAVDAVNISISSSQTSQDNRNPRYEELMNEIPSYINHLVSATDKEDATKKTIYNLQKLYMGSCQKECKESLKKIYNDRHVSTNKKFGIGHELIVENPLDYMRSEYKRKQNRGPLFETLSTSPSPGEDMHLPAPTPYARPGPHICIVPFDTPDYNYYPHRLK